MMPEPSPVRSPTRDLVRTSAIGIFAITFAVALFLVFAPFLVPIGWAAVLTLALSPIRAFLARFLPNRPALIAALLTITILTIFTGLIVPLILTIRSELEDAIEALNIWLSAPNPHLPESIAKLPVIGAPIVHWFEHFQEQRRTLLEFLSANRTSLMSYASQLAQGVVGLLFNGVMTMIVLFALLLHGGALWSQLQRGFFKLGGQRFARILETIQQTTRGAIYGVVVTALVQGVLAGLGYWVAGAPVPLLLGLLTTALSILPFGTPLVYVPVALYLLAIQSSWLPGLLLFGWGVGVVSMSDNIVRPYFISQAANVPVLLVLLGVMGGIIKFGLLGIFIGPALCAVAVALWLEWTSENQAKTAP